MNQELSNYIQVQLKQGISKESIKNTLISTGWQEKDIDEAMNDLQNPSVYGDSASNDSAYNTNPFDISSVNNNEGKKVPILVVIGSILILLSGLFGFIGSVMLLFLGAVLSPILIIFAIITLIISVFDIVLSFGLRKMRRWALYILTAMTVLGFIMFGILLLLGEFDLRKFGDLLIQSIFIGYCWTLIKDFT